MDCLKSSRFVGLKNWCVCVINILMNFRLELVRCFNLFRVFSSGINFFYQQVVIRRILLFLCALSFWLCRIKNTNSFAIIFSSTEPIYEDEFFDTAFR